MQLLLLHGVADGFVVWQMENYKKSFIHIIVLRKYQVSQMSSSTEPHLAREPKVTDP